MMHTTDPDQCNNWVSYGPDADFSGQWEETIEAELPLESLMLK